MSADPISDGDSAARELLRALFDAALAAADPARAILPYLPPPVAGRTVVTGAGKASAGCATQPNLNE